MNVAPREFRAGSRGGRLHQYIEPAHHEKGTRT